MVFEHTIADGMGLRELPILRGGGGHRPFAACNAPHNSLLSHATITATTTSPIPGLHSAAMLARTILAPMRRVLFIPRTVSPFRSIATSAFTSTNARTQRPILSEVAKAWSVLGQVRGMKVCGTYG